ncbi:hypothetical protein ABID82_005173 [Methylobacterium sp. PvP062]|uniref:Uncharacterized protein n=1 Tax=Methylobacterium radiotolerans TaxID=31998 RepID=A0ABV2NTR4_9HYPH|nr:hypothetical protein [Methylobacterium sp. PvP105]MBP2505666.1 hypothetical protein [Methylobacterium sp. PvP109]
MTIEDIVEMNEEGFRLRYILSRRVARWMRGMFATDIDD